MTRGRCCLIQLRLEWATDWASAIMKVSRERGLPTLLTGTNYDATAEGWHWGPI